MNLIEAAVRREEARTIVTFGESKLELENAALASPLGEIGRGERRLLWGIRPEALEEADPSRNPSYPRLDGIVELREQHGSDVYVHVSLAGSPTALGGFVDDAAAEHAAALDARGLVVARLSPRTRAREGAPIRLAADPAGVHFFDLVTEERI